MSAIAMDDFEIGVADEPTHVPVVDDEDRVIGHVDLRLPSHVVDADEFNQLRHELMQLRNLYYRLQTQVKLLEGRCGRR